MRPLSLTRKPGFSPHATAGALLQTTRCGLSRLRESRRAPDKRARRDLRRFPPPHLSRNGRPTALIQATQFPRKATIQQPCSRGCRLPQNDSLLHKRVRCRPFYPLRCFHVRTKHDGLVCRLAPHQARFKPLHMLWGKRPRGKRSGFRPEGRLTRLCLQPGEFFSDGKQACLPTPCGSGHVAQNIVLCLLTHPLLTARLRHATIMSRDIS